MYQASEKELEEMLKRLKMMYETTTPAAAIIPYAAPSKRTGYSMEGIGKYDSMDISDLTNGLYGSFNEQDLYGEGKNPLGGYNIDNKSIIDSYGKGDSLAKSLYGKTGDNYGEYSGKGIDSSGLGSGGKAGGKISSSGSDGSSSGSAGGSGSSGSAGAGSGSGGK
ncbi:hypothetical protein GF361_03495 [Candidatus Woesearchaeota archaeon]|nr:hypothetical protein [Candidatus Woesearchaeota archaeon]